VSRLSRTLPLLALVSLPSLVQGQEFKSPIWGGSGGTRSYNLDCGNTGVIVGVYGKAGLWLDQIGIMCQTINADGTLGGTFTRGPTGGSGGASTNERCNPGYVVAEAYGHAGSYVNGVQLDCYRWNSGTRRVDFSKYSNYVALAGPSILFSPQDKVRCPEEKVAKAVRGRSGIYIDSLQFVCDDWNK